MPNKECTFICDEVKKKRSLIKMQKSNYRMLWSCARTILPFDLQHFCHYVAKIDNVKDEEYLSKNERNLCLLRLQRFGNTAYPNKKNISNLSDHKLFPTEEFLLSHRSPNCSTLVPSPSITRKALRFESQTERFGTCLLRHTR